MFRSALVHSLAALFVFAATITNLRNANAATPPFSDFLVQSPKLVAPERGSVGGALAHLGFAPGSLSRGDFNLPIPIGLPSERGTTPVNFLPSYAPGNGQSEWGMGWRVDLSIRRFAIVGDLDMSGDEFVSPWGRLIKASDGRYVPIGAAPRVALLRVDGGWEAVDGDGTKFTFAAADAVAGSYAWMLSRIDGVLGETTVFGYVRNPSGRPFVSSVEWGGRGSERQYRLELSYETLAIILEDYRAGSLLALDRRVHEIRVGVRSATGTFETRWTYRLDYTQSPQGAAFYLTGVTKTNHSGEVEPTQRYSYDFGATTLAAATLVDVPALSPVLAAKGGDALQPNKATPLDFDDDGLIDFEIANDQSLVRQQGSEFTLEALPSDPAAIVQCRQPAASANPPRVLARMTGDATALKVFRSITNGVTSTTRVLVCNRQGVPELDQQLPGEWGLGPTTHLVDLNHDHRPDLIRIFSRGYQVVENTSDETGYHFVVHSAGTLTDAFTPNSSWVQDMNGDGQADLVMRFSSSVAVWYGQGQFRFAGTARSLTFKSISGTTVIDLAQRQLTFADVNHDGLMDVITTRGRLLGLFINDGHQLNEVLVPGLSAMSWDFGVPVVADVTGSGNIGVLFVQGTLAKAIQLSAPATGLMVSADDGKGSVARFGYAHSEPRPGIEQRTTVLDTFTLESSGYDPVSYSYRYGAPVLHSVGKHLIGFASADKRSPLFTEHVEFLNDDDISGVHSLSEDTDDRTPGIVRFTRQGYDDFVSHGVRWLRPLLVETGYRNGNGSVRLSTTTQYTTYERDICPTVIETTSPSGQLVSTSTLTSVAAIPDELHCLTGSQSLFGMHPDSSLDFTYLVNLARNDLGQVTRVTQFGPTMTPLVLQDISYGADHRVASIGAPGRGTTVSTHDGLGRLTTLTDPVGIVTRVGAFDSVSDALLELETARPNAPLTAFFEYDGRERLQASWDDVSGAGPGQPLVSYAYQDPTSTSPGRIDTQTLADAITGTSRRAVDLLAADGEPLVAGAWLGDHFSLGAASITFRNTLTKRSSFVGTMTDAALSAMTSADVRALGTPLLETVTAGFGYPVQTTTTQQAGVVGTVTTELLLGPTELVTRVHQPGGFTSESAVDAAGKLVRKTDENGVVHRYTYDAIGRLVHLATPDGGHTLAFDGFGRPARVAADALGAVTYAYDATTGLPIRKQRLDATGMVTDTSDTRYDAIGRPVQVAQTAAKNASELSFDYDGQLGSTTQAGQLGRLTRVRGDGWERSSLFDALGRPYEQHLTLTGWRDLTSDKTYRADGSVSSDTLTIADPAGTVTFSSTKETVLDGVGRIAALKVDGAVLYTLSYDAEGRPARADFTSGEAITFDYDAVTHQRRGHQVDAPDSTGGTHWERDPRGLISAETYLHGSTTTRRDYSYDGRGALTRATTGADVANYAYTASGLPDTISDIAGARSVHHVSDRLTVGDDVYAWDAAGRVIGKGEWTFDYGGNGQFTHASRPGRQLDYVYDDGNQRLLKRVDGVPVRADVAGAVLTEDHFVELVTVAGVVAGVLDNGQFTALLTDARGTPFAGPDGTPGLASPYGVRVSHLALAEVIDYARLGWDADLDVVRMGVRDYDAKLSQFLTPDPLYFEDLDKCQASPLQCSLYGYAGGNPVSFVDPTGLDRRTDARNAQETAQYFQSLGQSMAPDRVLVEGALTTVLISHDVAPLVVEAGISMIPIVGTLHQAINGASASDIAISGATDLLTIFGGEGEVCKIEVAAVKLEAALTKVEGSLGRTLLQGGEDIFVRRGTSFETATRLEKQAMAAEKAGVARNGTPYGHGVSVTTPESNARLARDPADASYATRSALKDEGFEVRHTPTAADPMHHTVQLPAPVTPQAAGLFNRIFGRRP